MHSRNALPSSKKTHSEKHKQILKQLLKEGSNKTCSDCKTAVHPRWASWSLGCFVCIRCSGIHRSMGTHISKVKSVDLDAWTDEQVENMLRWGNDKCNLYWEAKLPDGYIPDGSKIENFIRTKYDMKKWVSSPTVPNPNTLQGGHKAPVPAVAEPAPSSSSKTASPQPQAHSRPGASNSNNSANLLDDDFGSFTSSPSSSVSSRIASPADSRPPSNVNGLNNNSNSNNNNNNNSNATASRLPVQNTNGSFKNQSAQSTGGSLSNTGRPDLKKSILSLYSSPSSSSSSIIQPQSQSHLRQASPHAYGQQPQHQQPQPQQSYQQQPQSYNQPSSVTSLTSSLNGLNFNSTPSQSNSYSSSNSTPTPQAKSSWNNEWSETAPAATKSSFGGSNSTLDDDLFKNVWK